MGNQQPSLEQRKAQRICSTSVDNGELYIGKSMRKIYSELLGKLRENSIKGGEIFVIIESEVKMVINQYNFDYYKNLGYDIQKCGQRIFVKVSDLPKTSGIKIHTICEYCGEIVEKSYRRYIESIECGKNCCSKCLKYKIPENALEKYGYRSTLRIPEIHESVIKNNLKKYGCENPLESAEIRAKGVRTMQNRYGCSYTLQSDELREKCNRTLYENGDDITATSRQQRYLCDLYKGELNYSIWIYHIDILLSDNICCEYDGSGHDLSVKLGNETRENFIRKENKRITFLTNHNYKLFKILSNTDILPSDEILLNIKKRAFEILKVQNYMYYEYNLDTNIESFK